MEFILTLIVGIVGVLWSFRYLHINYCRFKQFKIEGSKYSKSDKYLNVPLALVWYVYLVIFFIGIFINNL